MGDDRKTILIVEDEAIIALATRAILEKNGYSVLVVYSGRKAVETVESKPGIDLILMDIDLGRGMDGTEAAERILLNRDVPVLFLSSHTETEIVERTEKITSYGYVVKNTGETVLLASIRMAFRLHDAQVKIRGQREELERVNLHLNAVNMELMRSQAVLIEREEALQESEEKFRNLFELLPAVALIHVAGKVALVNSQTVATFRGTNLDDFVGRNIIDFFTEEDREKPVQHMRARSLAAPGKLDHYTATLRRLDGTTFPADIYACNIPFQGGTATQALVYDITDRLKAEEALRQSEAKYRTLIENINDIVYVIDRDGRFTYLSPSLERISGYSADDLVGKKFSELVYPEDLPHVMEDFGKVVKGVIEPHEFRVVDRDGSVLHMRTSSRLVTRGGVAAGITGVMTNITDRKLMENALRESEEQNQMIFDNTNLGIFLSTLDGAYLKVNQAVLKISGYDTIEEFLRVPTSRLYADPADQRRIVAELRGKGSVRNVEFRTLKKDGTPHWISLSAVTVKDRHGAMKYIIGFVEDVTERRRAGELIKAERDLGLRLAGAASMKEVMQFGLSAAISTAGMESGGVYLINEPGGADLIVHEGLSEAFLEKAMHYDAGMPSMQVIMKGDSIFLEDSDDSTGVELLSRFEGLAALLRAEGLKALAVLPIQMKGEVIACMNISSRVHRTISPHVRMALEVMAASMGSAILRMKMQESLLDRESRFRSYFEMTHVGTAISSVDKRWLELNDRICEILGYTADELKGLTWAAITHPDDLAENVALFDRVLAGEIDGYTLDKRFIRKNGEIVWTTLGVGCVRKKDGTVSHFVTVLNDITDRKLAEERLKLSEEKFQRSFMTSPIVLCIARLRDFQIVDVNDTFVRMSGRSREEVLGMTAPELFIWDNLDNRAEAVKMLLTEGKISGREYGFRTRDGRLLIGEYSAYIIDIAGENHILVSIVDITDRKRAEERIQALLAEKDILLKEVHHRIKNNMSTIISLLDMQSHLPGSGEAAPALRDAVSRVQSMRVLYDKLYQSISLVDMSIRFYLPPLVEEICSLFPGCESTRVETRVDDFIVPVKVLSTLGIIVNELITNALKYAFPGGRKGTIRVSAAKAGRTATLAVEDDGIGLPDGFDINASTGFGLGLVVMLVRQIGGTISTGRGEGARFVIEFDLAE